MICKLILIVSLVFNILLYFGIIDLGQYRGYIDKWIEIWKKAYNSEEMQQFIDLGWKIIRNTKEDVVANFWDDYEMLKSKSKDEIKKYLKEKYPNMEEKYATIVIDQILSSQAASWSATNWTWDGK